MAPMAASRTFVMISFLRSRDAVMIMLSSWLCVHQRSSAGYHHWQSGRQGTYGCEVLRNLRETAPDHRDHLTTTRVRRKAGEEQPHHPRHTRSAEVRPGD